MTLKKSDILFLYAYAPLHNMAKLCTDSYGYALIDHNGHLMKLFSNDTFYQNMPVSSLEQNNLYFHITVDILQEYMTDPRAICLLPSACPVLNGYTMYYVPILMDLPFLQTLSPELIPYPIDEYKKYYDKYLLGGVILLSKTSADDPLLSRLVVAVVSQIFIQLHWFNISYQDYSDDTCTISLSQQGKKNQITMMSSNAYKLFGLPPADSLRQSLESIIPYTVENHPFYNIVNNRKIVTSQNLLLTINETQYDVSVSTRKSNELSIFSGEFVISIQSLFKINYIKEQYSLSSSHYHFNNIIHGSSQSFRNCLDRAIQISQTDVSVLLTGESGVGKDVFAQAIHNHSKRKNRPFVALNCAAFSKDLVNSELFGYEKGAFTGANKSGSIGRVEMANHGTLFLDEIGDMPLELQANLLRVIEQKRFMKVGGTHEIYTDVRIIAATNKNLKALIEKNLFRADLYYRLSVVKISIPSLRDRQEDIMVYANTFMKEICKRYSRPPVTFSDDAIDFLQTYHWPGNIRELRNVLESVICTSTSSTIYKNQFLAQLDQNSNQHSSYNVNYTPQNNNISAPVTSNKNRTHLIFRDNNQAEKDAIIRALHETNNDINKAASLLGISRRTLYRRLHTYNLMK